MDENTCRICLQESNTLISMHSKEKEESVVASSSPYEKLFFIMKINVSDRGSSLICRDCLHQLEDSVRFVQKCERSNQILDSLFSETSTTLRNECFALEQHAEVPDVRIQAEITEPVVVIDPQADPKNTGKQQSPRRLCPQCNSRRGCAHCPPTVYTCQLCNKVFTRKFNYNIHVKRHLGERPYPCPSCGAGQVSSWLARAHCSPRERRRRACPLGCGRLYTSTHNLNAHIRTHTGEKPHECTHCEKRFNSKSTLNDHIRTHTGARPFLCSACGARFVTNKLAAHHRRAHTDTHTRQQQQQQQQQQRRRNPAAAAAAAAASLACPWCGLVYRHKQSLNRHVHKRHPTHTHTNTHTPAPRTTPATAAAAPASQMLEASEVNLKEIVCLM